MTRRELFSMPLYATVRTPPPPLTLPLHIVQDSAAKLRPAVLRRFWTATWPEALRDLGFAGIRVQTTFEQAVLWKPDFRPPMIPGLQKGVLNLVLTDRIPEDWDRGRAINGVTTLYRSFHVCMLALNYAHGNQIPFLSVNTCLHEMLHALLHDIFEDRPRGLSGQFRESRIDSYATRLWLFHDGSAVHAAARDYIARLSAVR